MSIYRRLFCCMLGRLWLEADELGVTAVYIEGMRTVEGDAGLFERDADADCIQKEYLLQAEQELSEYFRGERRKFGVPLHLQGTEFQRKVWEALRQIPYGETRSYSEIAQMIGRPQACRAVGGANNRNPVLLLVPCHRVIGKDGGLVGFAGDICCKQQLLELEAAPFLKEYKSGRR